MKAVDFFTRDVHSFWATSYQLDLKLFDQFLLRRLGSAPLNAVLLCDEDSVTEALSSLSDIDRHIAANANRRYVLRGVRPPGRGRFHPKTYLFGSPRSLYLLIGSGNLTRTGLDRGRETFVLFDGSRSDELAVIQSWAGWIRRLVGAQGDAVLRRRYEHLVSSIPSLVGPGADPQFVTNDGDSVLDQIVRRLPGEVAELHVCAPYFDQHAIALRGVVERLQPSSEIHVYLGARTNVDGPALKSVLEAAAAAIHVHRFDPSDFVHAKLLGIVCKNGRGLLACGSANLSQAALLRTYATAADFGNCEAVVVREGAPDDIRAAFVPPNHEVIDVSLDAVEDLEYESDDEASPGWPVRLRRAALSERDYVQIEADDPWAGLLVRWDDSPSALELGDGGSSMQPVPSDSDPLIVWLADSSGQQRSNPVVLDDPAALEAALGESASKHDRPDELREEESTSDLTRLLTWAHRRFIFDVDDTPALQRATNAQEQQADTDDTDFWERYAREELTSDPRSQSYRPIGSTTSLTEVDVLLREIEAMLNAAPKDRRLRLIRAGEGPETGDSGTGHPWSFTARERLRSRNLLRRWARALADPRHAWIAAEAPARNYEALIEVLALIWLGGGLDDEVLVDLLGEVWTAFMGGENQRGFLDRAEPDLAAEVLDAIGSDARQLGAGLAYCAVAPDLPWARWIYEWQSFLVRGLERGIFASGPLAEDLVEGIRGTGTTSHEIENVLRDRAEWTDDGTWGDRLANELGLTSVQLVRRAGFKGVSTVVRAAGMTEPSRDPRLVSLARRTMAFKKSDHVLVEAGDERFLLRLGEICRARVGNETRTSIAPIDRDRLAAVEQQHGTLAELLGSDLAA